MRSLRTIAAAASLLAVRASPPAKALDANV